MCHTHAVCAHGQACVMQERVFNTGFYMAHLSICTVCVCVCVCVTHALPCESALLHGLFIVTAVGLLKASCGVCVLALPWRVAGRHSMPPTSTLGQCRLSCVHCQGALEGVTVTCPV
jgi:hypothetical protein